MTPRNLTRILTPMAAAATFGLTLVAPAAAHVSITPSTTTAGAYSVLTVSVSHGCDGSATTEVEIQLPEEVLSVTPTRNPFWDVRTTTVPLDEPTTDAHGNTVTERMGSVVYTAKDPLPDGQRDAFDLSLQLPDQVGTLTFPTVQTCVRGATGWVESPAEGQSADELDHPAPTVTVTEGDAGAAPADTVAGPASEGVDTMAALGVGAGVLGLLVGGAALTRARRRP
ncbi:YcnI family copper-binding membrane protein [Nocardioides antri]|uniref:YcnI family protein n=1 Tax=Nocardioides antri TaxID=2607659 RepID=A0A5B1MAB9_9ACTN|nr:YcnI family protein [Nocardioides antri]KAA1428670.1 YcnI family protein [Nocardioides antri]